MGILRYKTDFDDFSFLKKYEKVVVLGPQRSGTHFIASVIASELEYTGIPEDDIHSDEHGFRDWNKFMDLSNDKSNWCLQATDLMVDVEDMPSDIMVVIVIRPIDDIIKSQKQIGWEWDKLIKETYRPKYPDEDYTRPISEIRYNVWNNIQKKNIKCNYIEIDYNSMSSHPMWVPVDKRPSGRLDYPGGVVWKYT
jgi:hypothetical protein